MTDFVVRSRKVALLHMAGVGCPISPSPPFFEAELGMARGNICDLMIMLLCPLIEEAGGVAQKSDSLYSYVNQPIEQSRQTRPGG